MVVALYPTMMSASTGSGRPTGLLVVGPPGAAAAIEPSQPRSSQVKCQVKLKKRKHAAVGRR